MQHLKTLAGRSVALLACGSVLSAPALASVGTERNEAALGLAGRGTTLMAQCVKPVNTPLAVRNQCAMGDEANDLRGRGGGIIIGVAAFAAVTAGVIIAVKSDDDADGNTVPATPTPAPTPTPTPAPTPTPTPAPTPTPVSS